MSKIEELIQNMCPEGIEFKPLSEVFDMRNGYTPSKSNEAYWNNGTVNWFRMEDIRANGKRLRDSIQKITPEAVKKGVLFRANSIALSTSATIGEHALLEVDCLTNQRFTVFTMKKKYETMVDMNFVNYYFDIVDIWCKGHLNQGNFASVDMDALKKYEIPVPPMEIQHEIVNILDKFTELEKGLKEELEVRKKQYEYYRDKLMDNVEGRSGKLIEMLCQPVTDGPHTTPKLVSEGIPFISATAIHEGRIHFEDAQGFITKEFDDECAKKYKPKRDDVYMVKSGSTTGKVGYVDTDVDFNIWSPLAAMRVNSECSARYLFHLLQTQSIQFQVSTRMSHGSQPNLSMRVLEQFDVIIPTLQEQTRIVNILEKYDTLCNDNEKGLPAEIEARHKQYEFYRDKLLTFERKEV